MLGSANMEDEDIHNISPDRIKQLGFKPQKEIVYNKLLPYADELDVESQKSFTEIKIYLSKSVMLREMYPGCRIWAARLVRYIKLYGLKFSKEDHIALVNLLYEIVIIPDLDPYLVNKFSNTLIILLKKKYLLSPDDIVLEWRPLYDLCKRIFYSRHKNLGMYRYFSSLEHTLDFFVHSAKTYFSETATQEILDELKPQLSALSCFPKAMEFLEWFLPISLPPEKSHLGYKLWLTDMMELWDTCNNVPVWENEMMRLVANLASNNIGYIDWEPYIPIMFTRFLRSFNLPVTYKQYQAPRLQKVETSAVALWIASVLGNGNSCQKYLDKFLKTIESYFHPANFGVWFLKLKDFLRKLPQYFIQRLHYERYKKLTWETPVPDSHKLTEEDIDRFVESMKNIAMQAVFSKLGCTDASVALQHLATLRPKIIIPALIERLYSTLDSVTEPHKLTSLMQCMATVARPLVQGSRSGYPEGPTHVIPLLMSTLPGIDANDIIKSVVTIQFISVFVTLVPLVDSSKASEYYSDLTEEEEVICAATANFEDFIAQFFDRVFSFVESISIEPTRMEKDNSKRSRVEILAESALSSVCYSVLCQCSPNIFKTALKKLHTFITERIRETKLAGHFSATLCRVFSRVNPEETLRCLLPHLCNTVLSLTESEEVQKEEMLDDELHYNLLILAEFVDCCYGIMPYVPQLLSVLDRTLYLSSREGFLIASRLLHHLLLSLTTISPLESRGLIQPYDTHVKDFLPVREWGKPGNIYNLNLKWHVPGEEEKKWVEKIVLKYLIPELEKLEKHISDEEPLTREQLLCSFCIIYGTLGAHFMLPMWDEEPLPLLESALKMEPMILTLGVKGKVNMPDGSNIRLLIAHTMEKMQKKLLACAEDDTRSLFMLIQIWERLLLNKIKVGNDDWKSFQLAKKALGNPLIGKKRHMRVLLINRTILQHESRIEKAVSCLTKTHKMIMLNLLELSCSHYSEVRKKAQGALFQGLGHFSYSYTVLLPQLLKNLQEDSIENHEKFKCLPTEDVIKDAEETFGMSSIKGSLYVLLGPKQRPIISRHDWDLLLQIWPALVKAKPSEKLSVVKLLNSIGTNVHQHFPTITISLEIPDICIEKAKILLGSLAESPLAAITEAQVEEGKKVLELKGERNHQMYLNLLDSLMDAMEANNLHWRYYSMALCFIRDLVHPDIPYPARIVKTFLNCLINDSLELRKVAIKSTLQLLSQQKREQKKIKVDIEKISGCPLPKKLIPGIRPDNLWLQYSSEKIPKNSEEWNEPRYMHKPTYGYFQWPKEFEMYAPASEQPPLDRTEDELEPEEKEVYNFFTNSQNLAQLIKYFSLEEKKGKDKFSCTKFRMFKKLFRNHGDTFLEMFKPHLETLVVDKHESSQRCAAEIIAGIIRGSKHWPYEKVSSLWKFLGPLIRTALSNMTEETLPDWGTCFASAAENRDPIKNHWLLEVLMEDPLREESSFLGCGRLFVLQGALIQQEWRVTELYKRLLKYFGPFLNHPFQNIRERIARMLINIFLADIKLPGAKTLGPHPEEFLAEIVPKLEILYSLTVINNVSDNGESKDLDSTNKVISELSNKLNNVNFSGREINNLNNSLKEKSLEKEMALRLLKTICKWITGTLSRSHRCTLPEFYSVFPLICSLESYDQDEELVSLCSKTLAALARCATAPQHIPIVFKSIWKVAQSGSWWARSSIVVFLQVFIFHNMSLVLSNPEWTNETAVIVLKLLEDERVEVREKAAEVLGGLLHCDFISNTDELLENFKIKAKTKNKKLAAKNPEILRIRHSGILGLCSFINSSPYDVPDYVPEIFLVLGNHLSDPQPIPSTIRKTLGDFKRTHHDNWDRHQLKFTEKQLEVLNDLNVPPAYIA